MSSRERILIIDDEQAVCGFLMEFLEGEGYAVFTAATADEAMMFMGTQAFDVIMTDIRMPGLSGIELLRQVREYELKSQVIIMTSYATVDTAIEAIRYGAYDYMKKPLEDLDYVLRLERDEPTDRDLPVADLLESSQGFSV